MFQPRSSPWHSPSALAWPDSPRPRATAPAPLASEDRPSIAVETDILSYFFSGYSVMVNVSLPNKFQAAFGIGNYDVPDFLVEGDPNFDVAQWEARVTSVQVLRATYRFRGPMRSGPALGGVILNQNWHLKSAPLNGETTLSRAECRADLGATISTSGTTSTFIRRLRLRTTMCIPATPRSMARSSKRSHSHPTHRCTWVGHGDW